MFLCFYVPNVQVIIVPKDIAPKKCPSSLTQGEKDCRWHVLKEQVDLRSPQEKAAKPNPVGWDSSRVPIILTSIREVTYNVAKPLINTKLAHDLARKFPNFKFADG